MEDEMTVNEIIKQLSELEDLQYDYDRQVFAVHGVESYKSLGARQGLALLSEIGELNQELKGNWCYWKFTQNPVDREKALEELADVMHFLFSLVNRCGGITAFNDAFSEAYYTAVARNENLTDDEWCERLLTCFLDFLSFASVMTVLKAPTYLFARDAAASLALLIIMLGFDWSDAKQAYLSKNRKNRERLKNGY